MSCQVWPSLPLRRYCRVLATLRTRLNDLQASGTLAATLPAAGVYTILIDPTTYRTGTVTAAVTAP